MTKIIFSVRGLTKIQNQYILRIMKILNCQIIFSSFTDDKTASEFRRFTQHHKGSCVRGKTRDQVFIDLGCKHLTKTKPTTSPILYSKFTYQRPKLKHNRKYKCFSFFLPQLPKRKKKLAWNIEAQHFPSPKVVWK